MMDEQAAEAWLTKRFGADAMARLARFADAVLDENARQNLISRSTEGEIWSRHVVDSAQLLDHAGSAKGKWIDVGTGGGFPGMVIALLRAAPILLVEPRRKRAEFLTRLVGEFDLDHAEVRHCKVERVPETADVISARAVALPDLIIGATWHCSHRKTRWLLPRGGYDGANAREWRTQNMMFHVEHSLTDPSSVILIGDRA